MEDGGFDIAGSGDAFGLVTIHNRSNLVAVNLTTGQANMINDYPATVSYSGLAIGTPAVAYAADSANNLSTFNPLTYYNQNNVNSVLFKAIAGLAVGETIRGIDFCSLN